MAGYHFHYNNEVTLALLGLSLSHLLHHSLNTNLTPPPSFPPLTEKRRRGKRNLGVRLFLCIFSFFFFFCRHPAAVHRHPAAVLCTASPTPAPPPPPPLAPPAFFPLAPGACRRIWSNSAERFQLIFHQAYRETHTRRCGVRTPASTEARAELVGVDSRR